MPTSVEYREKLEAKQATLAKAYEIAGEELDFNQKEVLEHLGAKSSQEAVEKVKALNAEMDDLFKKAEAAEIEEIGANMKRVKADLARPVKQPPQPNGDGRGKTLGELFVESEGYKAYRATQGEKRAGIVADLDIELKTLFQTSAGWAPESTRIARVIDAVTRPIQVLDIIPFGQTNQASVVYMEETTRTHSTAEKAEGIAYAESTFALTERTSTVRKITDSIPVTDEQLEDEAQVRSYLDQRLRFGLRQRLDTQVITGNGTAPNLLGILNKTGIQTQAKGADPTFDAIHKAMTKVRVTGRANPNAVVLHPNDWEAIRLTRTADGIYILGNPAEAGPMTLFGIPVAVGDVETENTGLVGDFANFCMIHERRGIRLMAGYSGTQFAEGKQLLRADMRVAFTVFRAAAFCTVTGI